ncbi:annexin B10 isoform X1 [Belonocnema kinseyi]|uniref:annexin B10 isoform X1 n=1 Tax=Belonocnema kinseyi TaxID=2817044 RepID=UPI00143DB23B|nr:annexin B10 isoform X1 [Belonocnema kinseyi]
MAGYAKEPTVVSKPGFNAAEDGVALRTAMKGLGTDEQAIIDILTARSNSQRQEIAKFFTQEYGRNIIEDLKSELGGKFEDVILALMTPPVDFMAKQLHKAMSGIGTEEEALVEILCSRDNREVGEIVEAYEELYNRPLAEHLCSETSGDFRRLLTLIVTNCVKQGVRNAQTEVHPERARETAEMLYNAGEGKLGTDEEIFNKILAHECFGQLRLIFEAYKEVSGRTIEQALRDEVSGELKDAMLAIVECVQSPPTFFAKKLRKAMEGAGTDDQTLIRIIVSRSEIDLGNIKRDYERLYDKTLESSVKNETSGDYKRALVALIGGP